MLLIQLQQFLWNSMQIQNVPFTVSGKCLAADLCRNNLYSGMSAIQRLPTSHTVIGHSTLVNWFIFSDSPYP